MINSFMAVTTQDRSHHQLNEKKTYFEFFRLECQDYCQD